MKKSIILCITLVSSIVCYTQPTIAAQITVPGIMCDAYYGSETANFSSPDDTGIRRTAAGSGWISCPVIRGGSVRNVYVNVNHPTARTTTCDLTRSGSNGGRISYQRITLSGTGNLFKVFPDPSQSGSDTFAVSCSISQYTTFRGYDWVN